MKRIILVAAATLIINSSALAQRAPEAAKAQSGTSSASAGMTVDQILEKYVNALGGRAALEKITSRVSKGIMTLPESFACLDVEIDQKAPNKYLSIGTSPCLEGMPFMRRGFNGAALWDDSIIEDGPSTVKLEDVVPTTGGILKEEIDEGEFTEFFFYSNINLKNLFPQLTLKGKEIVANKEAYVLEVTHPRMKRWYFDSHSGLLLASTTYEGGVIEREIDYLDYRVVDGISIPFVERTFRAETLEKIIKLTEVRNNVSIIDAKFNPPAKHAELDIKLQPFVKTSRFETFPAVPPSPAAITPGGKLCF